MSLLSLFIQTACFLLKAFYRSTDGLGLFLLAAGIFSILKRLLLSQLLSFLSLLLSCFLCSLLAFLIKSLTLSLFLRLLLCSFLSLLPAGLLSLGAGLFIQSPALLFGLPAFFFGLSCGILTSLLYSLFLSLSSFFRCFLLGSSLLAGSLKTAFLLINGTGLLLMLLLYYFLLYRLFLMLLFFLLLRSLIRNFLQLCIESGIFFIIQIVHAVDII